MASGQSQKEAETSTLADQLASHEKALIAAAISANGGRLKETYEALGLSRKSLYDKMQRYGWDDFANDEMGRFVHLKGRAFTILAFPSKTSQEQ